MDLIKSWLAKMNQGQQQTMLRPDTTSESQRPLLQIDNENNNTNNIANTPNSNQEPTVAPYDSDSSSDSSQYTRPSEILGWLLYALATEPFVVSAMGTYVPLLLEQFARENGVRLDNHELKCISGDPVVIPGQPPILPPPHGELSSTSSSSSAAVSESLRMLFSRSDNQRERQVRCVLYILGYYLDTSSFALYTFSLSVLLQTLTVVSMSGAADRGHYRKHLLLYFGFSGALLTISFGWLDEKRYYLASLLAILAISCFGAVNVCGNSYLPILTGNSREIHVAETESGNSGLAKSNLTTKLSGLGAATGYSAALFVQLLTMLLVIKTGTTTKSIQYAISFVGLWWFVFLIPVVWLLRTPKVTSTAETTSSANQSSLSLLSSIWKYTKYGWWTLYLSMKHASTMKDVLIYLLGWFIISDSITTMNSTAILFAKTELLMTTPQLVLISILTVISAIAGSVIIPKVQSKYSLNPKSSMIYVILWASVIPLYGILGFFFSGIGLRSQGEMFILAVWYGISMGGLATISRSLFSLLIPKGKESTFFSLFAVTDKGSSIIGPLIVGLITDKFHNIRYCFWFLLALMWLSLPVWWFLDVQRGEIEARELQFVDEEESVVHDL